MTEYVLLLKSIFWNVVLPEDEVSVSVDEVERVPGRVGRLVEGAQRAAEPHVLLRRGGGGILK